MFSTALTLKGHFNEIYTLQSKIISYV